MTLRPRKRAWAKASWLGLVRVGMGVCCSRFKVQGSGFGIADFGLIQAPAFTLRVAFGDLSRSARLRIAEWGFEVGRAWGGSGGMVKFGCNGNSTGWDCGRDKRVLDGGRM